jgi:hypothetical protein
MHGSFAPLAAGLMRHLKIRLEGEPKMEQWWPVGAMYILEIRSSALIIRLFIIFGATTHA